MDLIRALFTAIGPGVPVFLLIIFASIRSLARRSKRSEESDKRQVLDNLRLEGYMVKYCGLPIEVFLEDLKEKGIFLSSVPDDDLLSQIIEKQIGVKE